MASTIPVHDLARRACVAVLVALVIAAVALPAGASNDPFYSQQWALAQIHASSAWSRSTGRGITIAIVDSGIDLTHEDLASKIVAHETCLNGSCSDGGADDVGHGTHVAGIAAAVTGNGRGVAGVAPGASLMSVKVLTPDGNGGAQGNCSDIGLGIRWAADHGARVINLSLGIDAIKVLVVGIQQSCSDLTSAADYAVQQRGAVVVVAAGNDALSSTAYSDPNLIVVGATGPSGRVAYYSNTGATVYAPGGDDGNRNPNTCAISTCVVSTWDTSNDAYAIAEGTSMATPHVSGIAALLLAEGYSNTAAMSRIQTLTSTTPDGYPEADAAAAVGVSPRGSGGGTTGRSGGSTSGGSSTGSGSKATVRPATVRPTRSPSSAPSASGSASPSPSASPSVLAIHDTKGGGGLAAPAAVAGALAVGIAAALLVARRRRAPTDSSP
jgi:subtilisin family serine protease